VKLCAAGNGMWPATAPDAARTFQGSIELVKPANSIVAFAAKALGLLRIPPTALPLLDDELGIHSESPACKDHTAKPQSGWDGEFGPYLQVDAKAVGGWRAYVNYADIRSVDYVENTLRDRFDASKLRKLTVIECLRRMWALRTCVSLIDRKKAARDTKYWLVSAQSVDWAAFGPKNPPSPLPKALPGASELLSPPSLLRGQLRGQGYLFVFAKTNDAAVNRLVSNSGEVGGARNTVACDEIWCCYVSYADQGRVDAALLVPATKAPAKWFSDPPTDSTR
jgi:hypothetical protein